MFGSRFTQRRGTQFAAWLIFCFCVGVIFTGMLVGPQRVSVAQDEPAATNNATNNAQPTTNNAEGATNNGTNQAATNNATNNDVAATNGGTNQAKADAPPVAPPKDGGDAAGGDQQKEEPPAQVKRKIGEGQSSGFLDRAVSFLGIFFFIFLAWLMSNNRKEVNWKLVGWGVGLQLVFAVLIFFVPYGEEVFAFATMVVKKLLDFTSQGSEFIFASFITGKWEPALVNFTFAVLPTIIFFSAVMTIAYHTGIMHKVVYAFALVMQKTMNTSGAESLSAAANIFVGQTEAPLVVKPFVNDMTMSELMTVMTGGFATVAGGVLAIYVGMLEPMFPDIAGHLIAASVMSAPAALVIGKIMFPETETPTTAGQLDFELVKEDVNILDAASRGAAEGLQLALNVGAMLLAFIALIELVNYLLGLPGLLYNKALLGDLVEWYTANNIAIPEGCDIAAVADDAVHGCVNTMGAANGAPEASAFVEITMQKIVGYLFFPIAWVMGVPWDDCYHIGQLLGIKLVVNELVGYAELQNMLNDPTINLQDRSVIIATYALCGFANFGSIGIQLGGIGGIAPDRKHDLAKIAFRAMIAGTIAAFMTATIAGILV